MLDQFDLFAKRARQALLYCLLDAVQAGSYTRGLAVVGLTSRVDASELLEKRVKSRFSHRIIHLHPLPLAEYEGIARQALLGGDDAAAAASWRRDVDALFGQRAFLAMLHGLCDLSGDVRQLYQTLTIPVALAAAAQPHFTAADFVDATATQRADPLLELLLELTEPEMAILITARHLQMRDKDVFTFEMCFYELVHFAKRVQTDLGSAATGMQGAPRGLLAVAGLQALAAREPIQRVRLTR